MKTLIQYFVLSIFLIPFSFFLTLETYAQSEINKTENLSGEKSTYYRFDKIRSGAVLTDSGWNVQDFAQSLFNPNSDEIIVTWKMISDDPQFVFANGQVGTYTKTYQLKPMSGLTDNVYMSPIFVRLKYNEDESFTNSIGHLFL